MESSEFGSTFLSFYQHSCYSIKLSSYIFYHSLLPSTRELSPLYSEFHHLCTSSVAPAKPQKFIPSRTIKVVRLKADPDSTSSGGVPSGIPGRNANFSFPDPRDLRSHDQPWLLSIHKRRSSICHSATP